MPGKADAKQQRIDKLMRSVNTALGDDVVRRASDPSLAVTYTPTGILPVDVLLDGGLPRGRITEAFGDFSTLKSYIGLCAIAEVQKAGGVAALIDTERSFDPEWAVSVGVSVDDLLTPGDNLTTGEEFVDVTQSLVADDIDLVIWDSVASTLPQDEAKKKLGKENIQPARQAALMSAALRRINAVNRHTAIYFCNQTRSKVGVVYGSPETTPGGRSLPFYASYRLRLSKAGRTTSPVKVWTGGEWKTRQKVVAQQIRVELIKSKLNRPEREVWLTWDVNTASVDVTGYLIAVGMEHGLVTRGKGSWKWNPTTKTFRGEVGLRGAIETDSSMRDTLLSAASGGAQEVAKKKVGGARRIRRSR